MLCPRIRAVIHLLTEVLAGRRGATLFDEVESGHHLGDRMLTCKRVFISMKKNASGWADATMNSTVPPRCSPTLRAAADGGRNRVALEWRHRSAVTVTLRSPSGDDVAESTRRSYPNGLTAPC